MHSLVNFLAVLLRRWDSGGDGSGSGGGGAPLIFWMLHTLALSSVVAGRPNLVQRLWAFLQLRQEQLQQKRGGFLGGGSNMALIPFSSSFSFSSSSSVVLSSELEEEEGDRCAAALLCALLSQLLVVLDDSEMYDDGKPCLAPASPPREMAAGAPLPGLLERAPSARHRGWQK